MLSSLALAAAALIATLIIRSCLALQKNIEAAKQSGLPYVTTPVFQYNRIWLIFSRSFIPILRHLPNFWSEDYLDFATDGPGGWFWKYKYDKFAKYGDVFLIVSPARIVVQVADAEAVSQITTRRNDFPKPLELYGAVDVFGKNLVSTEGAVWRHHRKISSPTFNENNNHLVWKETLQQTSSMVTSWLLMGNVAKDQTGAVWSVAEDTMRLSLHIISKAGFGQEMLWPFEQERRLGPGGHEELPAGHDLSFTDAMRLFLNNALYVLILPDWLRSRLPFKQVKVAHKSFLEWGKYLREILVEKKAMIADGQGQAGLDLMGALIKGADAPPSADALKEAPFIKSSMYGTPVSDPSNLFSDNEILGNAFVFLLAGHETVANTLHFTLLLLAMNPGIQRQVQQSLDDILGDRSSSDWDYDKDLARLQNSLLGAVINEELRLIAPVVDIPKSTPPGQPQSLTLGNGQRVTVPGNALIGLTTVGLHRNPRYWPRVDESDPNDLLRFKPQRWLNTQGSSSDATRADAPVSMEEDNERTSTGEKPTVTQHTGPSLYNPPRGAYIPFSEGARSCIGRRFAQVEALAALSTILKRYTVELDLAIVDDSVSGGASAYTENLKRKSGEERGSLWSKARERAAHHLDNSMTSRITLQMTKGEVPVRLVARGNERLQEGETPEAGLTAW